MLARLFRGGTWLGIGSVSEQGSRFVRNMILTRLLAPDVFGVMAIVLSIVSLSQVITGIGIKEGVIQNPRGTERTFLNGAWWLAIGRAFLLYLAVFFAAPFIASFYDKPLLTPLLRVAFLAVVAQGAMSPGAFVALKKMQYRPWVALFNGGAIIGVVTTIAVSFWLRSVWALVIGFIVEGISKLVLSFVVCPFRPGLTFHRQHLRELLKFARGIFGLPVLMLVYTQGSIFVLGKMCSKEELGLFAMVLTLARTPTMLGGMLVDLLMPTFSEIQSDSRRINRGLLKISFAILLAGVPVIALLAWQGSTVLSVIYGPQYAVGRWIFAILFANELLTTNNIPFASVFMAVGRPELLRKFSLIRAVLVIGALYPAIKLFGLLGGAIAPLFAMVAAYGLQLAEMRKLTGLDIPQYVRMAGRCLAAALPLVLVWLLFHFCLPPLSSLASLVALMAVTVFVYTAAAYVIFRHAPFRFFFWPFGQGEKPLAQL